MLRRALDVFSLMPGAIFSAIAADYAYTRRRRRAAYATPLFFALF